MMLQRRQATFLAKILGCVMLICTLLGSVFTLFDLGGSKLSANAATSTDVTDAITFTQDDWMTEGGSATDCITLSIRIYNETKTAWRYEYLVADPSIRGYWNDNGTTYATKNGVDIMDYLYFNDESARSIVTKNQNGTTSYTGTTFPLSTGSLYAPIAVETAVNWTSIKILNAWIPQDGFTITVKNGFKLLLSDGNIITTTDDASFKYANGAIAKVPTKTDVTETVQILGNTYTETQSQFKIALNPANTLTTNAWWNINGADLIAANYGLDIMEYIYINGENIRALSDDNRTNNTYPVGSLEGWFANSDQCRPVFVESVADGIYVTVLHAFSTSNYTITLKAGFELLNAEGKVFAITEDVEYIYNKGELIAEGTPSYTVTFDAQNGAQSTTVSVYDGSYVKEDQIPANPEKSADDDKAYTFWYWSLDGETKYDFTTPVTENITLKAVYTTQTLYAVTMGDATVKVVAGGKIEKPATDPVKESTAEFDYTFVGWYNGETQWNFYTDTVTSDLELTAKYTETKRKYTVTFNVSGKDGVSFASVEKEYGATVDLSTLLDDVDVTGYTYTITVDGVAVTSVQVLSDVTVNVTFTAKAYYTVTLGGAEQMVEEGAKVAKPATDPTKESTAEFDYTFDGWYNGETKWNFDTDTVNSDLELVAKYTETKRKYTVTFNVTGNNAIKLDPIEVEYGTTYDLSKLLNGKDVSGYTYTIKVNGEDKLSVKVVGNVTVNVAFTKKADNAGAGALAGCMGSISGVTGALLGMVALGVAVVLKKKEN